jgi:hypothetical protein
MSDVTVNTDSFSPPRERKTVSGEALCYTATGTLLFFSGAVSGEEAGAPGRSLGLSDTSSIIFSPSHLTIPKDPSRCSTRAEQLSTQSPVLE